MNDFEAIYVPLEVMMKGRHPFDVLAAEQIIAEAQREKIGAEGADEDEIQQRVMDATAYRLYLMGVEDGMAQEEGEPDE